MDFKRLLQFRIAHILVVTTICAAITVTLRSTFNVSMCYCDFLLFLVLKERECLDNG